MRPQQSKAAAAALVAIVIAGLSACGGGGGAAGDTSTSQTLSTTFPRVKPTVGEYYVFTTTSTVTKPAETAPTTTTSVRTFPVVNSDGSYTRVVTGSSPKQARDYAADDKVMASSTINQQCVLSPGYVVSPAAGTVVGQTYAGTTIETCTISGSTVPFVATLTTNGTADAIESVTTAAGTFRAFKSTSTFVTTSADFVTNTVETCWTDMVLGRTIKCIRSYSSTAQSDQSIVAAGSLLSELTAYSVPGMAPVGSTLARFIGSWRVTFAGAATGYCSSAFVTTAGVITSNCARTNSSGSVIGNFTVSGSVDVNGVVTATGSDGSTFTGSLISPIAGSGEWVNGAMAGTWAASHL